jgi:hypothetical protein
MIRIRKPDFRFLVLYVNKEQNILRLQKDTRLVLFEKQPSIKKKTNKKNKNKAVGFFPDPAVSAKSRSKVRTCGTGTVCAQRVTRGFSCTWPVQS